MENEGVARAYNQGIKIAEKENNCLFLISNNDIVFRPDSIDNLLSFARENPEVGYVTAIDSKRCFGIDYVDYPLKDESWAGLCNSCFLLKGWVVEKIGFYDPSYWPGYMEDLDYLERLNREGIGKLSTHTSIIKHDEGGTGRGNNWKLGKNCNTHTELYNHAYVLGKAHFKNKWGFCPS